MYFSQLRIFLDIFPLKGLEEGREREGKGRRPSFQKSSWRISLPLPHLSPAIGGARSRPPNRANCVSRRRRPLKVISTRRALSATCGEPRPRPHRRPSSVVARSGAQVLRHGALGATTAEGGSSSSLSQSRSCRACVSTASVAVSPDLSRRT